MKFNLKYTVALCLLGSTLSSTNTFAQTNATLMGSRVDPIRMAQNPAYISEERVVIGLGLSSLSTQVQSSASLSQLLTKTSETKSKIYLDEALRLLGDRPTTSEIDLNLFLLGIRSRAGFFSLGATLHTESEGGADKKLMDFLASGNGVYRGTQVTTKGLLATAQSYLDVSLGYATDRLLSSRRLSIGGRFKVLMGQANGRTSHGSLNFFTAQDGHELMIEGFQQLQLQGPRIRYSYDAMGLLDTLGVSIDDSQRFTTSNIGFGLDLGASYKLDDKLTFGLSLRNLGYIRWTKGHLLTLDRRGDKALRFRGVDISPTLTSNKEEDKADMAGFEALAQELKKHITIEEDASYTTPLPLKLHAQANYQALNWLSLSALAGMSKLGHSLRPDIALAVNCMPNRWFGMHLSASSLHGSPINLGAGLVVGRQVQFHLAVDNLLMLDLNNTKYASLTAGLNFRF